jgi:hypothetical protein
MELIMIVIEKNNKLMSHYYSSETIKLVIATASFIALLVIIFFIYRYIFLFLKRKVAKTPGKLDDFILDLFKIPALWVVYWIILKFFTHIFLSDLPFFSYLLPLVSGYN